MNMMHIGTNIARARENAGLNQSELGRALGLTAQAVQKWENGASTPRVAKIPQIAAALGVEVAELVRGTMFSESFVSIAATPVTGLLGEPAQVATMEMGDRLPLISWVQAGVWTEIQEGVLPEVLEEWIPCPFKHTGSAFVLKVVGDSNYAPGAEKSYAPGEFIAVDPGREALNRSMVVVRLDHENTATFKQLIIDSDGTQMLQALNPNWPKRIIEMPPGSKIIGVVIGKWVPE